MRRRTVTTYSRQYAIYIRCQEVNESLSGKGLGFDALLAIFGGNEAKSNGVKRNDLVRVVFTTSVLVAEGKRGNEVEASPRKTSQTSLSVVLNAWFLAGFYTYTLVLFTERRQRSLIQWVLKRKTKACDPDAPDFDGDGIVVPAEFVIYKLKEMWKISSHGQFWRLKSLSGKGLGFDALLAIFGGNEAKSNGVKRNDLVRVVFTTSVLVAEGKRGNEVKASPRKRLKPSLLFVTYKQKERGRSALMDKFGTLDFDKKGTLCAFDLGQSSLHKNF
ncbi:hypothetical protein Tco_0191104 [Tanacetum coccineum]